MKGKEAKKTNKQDKTSKVNVKMITRDPIGEKIEKKNRRIVLIALISFFALVFLFFLANKTFFRTEYNKNKFKIELPVFMYLISDKDNVVTFKTLRKSENIKQYFEEYLSNLDNFDYYVCSNGKAFYYNEANKNIIYDISITKSFALKTVKIEYDVKDYGEVCK